MLGFSASGLNLCHNPPKIIATDTQNTLTATTDIVLNPFTKSIGAVISSGFGGINANTIAMNIPYPTTEIIFDFDFIFLSGGGNDILAKGGIKRFLKDPLPGSGTIDDFFDKGKFALMLAEIKLAYEEIIRLRDQTETRPIIVVHGYDYPVVDNGVNLVVKKLGPWLFKYLRKKGAPEAVQREISVFLIDAFNQVLFDLAVENSRFVHVDTRGLLPDDGDWANEIHPTGAGFARVADRMLLEAGLS